MSQRGNEQNFQFLAADDPLYKPLQDLFYKQLIQQEQRLQLQQQQITAKTRKVQKDKQEIGVRLYNAQQQLAANQMDYQKAHDNFNIAQRLRIQSQQKLTQINQVYNSKKEELNILKGKVSKAQKELENLMKNYHQIQSYNIQLKSDIAVTKIETFTAQQNVTNLQKIKKRQDQLIDSMNEQSKRLEEQKNILAAQIISQKEQTQDAKKILREAQVQMQKVVASKKSLLQRWQKSIMMMQKRDSTVQTLTQRLRQQTQTNILLINEISGIRTQIRKEQEVTEKLAYQSASIATQKQALELQKNQLKDQQNKISSQLIMLKQSLGKTQEQIAKSQTQKKQIEASMNLIQTNIMKLHTQTKNLLEDLINQKSQHTTIEKTASNLLKQAHQLQYQIQEKEIDLENHLNQIARVKIDQLNTKSQIELLQTKKNEALAEQNDKKYLVITYQVQIRQGHDINEKKQHEVGRLNKLHDELMSKANDQGKNPLENKLINLVRETEQLQRNSNELYRQWIKKQTILVHENNKLQQLKQSVTNLENKKMIMDQKKARLNNNYKGFQKQISEIKIDLKGLQQQMNKLNDRLAVNSDKKSKLENENINLQSQFVQKLKEMEKQAIKLEINIDKIRQEKAELMNQIVQCQRQILLWERKYQLQQEMQEALDPNVGQSQIEELKKQIHRMELKCHSLTKEQQKITTEMLRTVSNGQANKSKMQALIKKQGQRVKKNPQTSNQLKKAVDKASKDLGKIMKGLQDVEKSIDRKKDQLDQISVALDQRNGEYKELELETHQLQTQTVMSKIRKLTGVLKVAVLQKKYKKFDQISNKTARLMYQQPILRQKLGEIKDKNNSIYQALENLSDKYPAYEGLLQPILETHTYN